MHEEIVDWAVAAYLSNRDVDDVAMTLALHQHGFSAASSARVTAMLPLAFGRQMLAGKVALSEQFCEVDASGAPGPARPLSADPMFVAARARAALASLDEIQCIAKYSSEVHGFVQARRNGANAANLQLGPPMIVPHAIMGAPGAAVDISPLTLLRAAVMELLAAHRSTLQVDLRLHPRKVLAGSVRVQVDFRFAAPRLGERVIVESFASQAATIGAAIADIVEKLARSSLPVLMAALEDETRARDHVQWRTWGPFRVCVGPLLGQFDPPEGERFGAYLAALEARIVAARLSPELHWFRTFVSVGEQIYGYDALLDTAAWQPGEELVTGWPWPRRAAMYSLRHLLVLVPAG
jgi:hypothetical protein